MTPLGNYLTRQKLTGRLFFQRVGQAQVDLGNVLLVKQEPKIDRAQQLTLSKGRAQITHEEPSKIDLRWSFKLAEQLGAQLQLLSLAKEVDATQIAVTDDFFSVNWPEFVGGPGPQQIAAAGTKIMLGALNITGVGLVLDPGTAEQELLAEGVDYSVDRPSGVVTILHDITFSEELLFNCQCGAAALKSYTLLSESFVRGTATIVLADENTPNIREKIVFSAEIRASDWGENDGTKNEEYSLELIELSAATVLTRE